MIRQAMPKTVVELSEHANRVVNVVKAREGLRGKSAAIERIVEEYEEKYNLERAHNPIDESLRDIRRRSQKEGEKPSGAAPKATPGKKEELIGPSSEEAIPGKDVTGKVVVEGAKPPETVSAPPEEKVAAIPKAPQAAAPRTPHFAVQVARFSDRDQAERFIDRLKDKRYDAYLSSAVVRGGGVVHTVMVGRFDSEADARRAADRIDKEFRSEETVPFVVKSSE